MRLGEYSIYESRYVLHLHACNLRTVEFGGNIMLPYQGFFGFYVFYMVWVFSTRVLVFDCAIMKWSLESYRFDYVLAFPIGACVLVDHGLRLR